MTDDMEQKVNVDNSIQYLLETGQIQLCQYEALIKCDKDAQKLELLNDYLNL
jgi:hypothetical protein